MKVTYARDEILKQAKLVSLATLFHVLMLYNIEGFNIWQIGLKVSRPSQED
jgi:hypothetical protein